MSGRAKISPANGKLFLSEKQQHELFKLINDGGSKREIEIKYYSMTHKELKHNTYKQFRKDAKES